MTLSRVSDLQRALAEIRAIRGQLALGTEFRGYGPATLALTGALALSAATLQPRLVATPQRDLPAYLALWVGTAALSLGLILVETVLRARRVHSGLAMEMVRAAFEQFLPAIVGGGLLTLALAGCAPRSAWLLPGLWQIIFSLGVFASCRFLPRQLFGVGIWYLATGLGSIVRGEPHAFSPWAMGVPFGIGQLLVALVLRFGYRERA